jgi:hypothetical protein
MRVFLAGIDRLAGLVIALAAPAVAVGIDHERGPALRRRRVAGRPEFLRVHPADDGVLALCVVAEPERVRVVRGIVQVLGAEASIDERELPVAGIVDGHLPGILIKPIRPIRQRIELRGAERRVFAAIGGDLRWRPHLGRKIDTALLVCSGRGA